MTDTIETALSQPKKAAGDGTTVEMHTLKDQIAADNHVIGKKATRSGAFPFLAKKVAKAPGSI